ncbi:addiction module antitoxin [Marinicella pacifica]|jgi:antitoxin ParD1/3/4|uniref:Antitoxin ParD n=1 Tax=Marinicella pacifica TaxID=1171543 RepID=A0A917CUS8_9GAMM|nr:type II toxin-antitoxin system ParD family antitoxin [Marinicella pacifica]GGF98894.1 addiction module antitoxin [Marinicella pacifica]
MPANHTKNIALTSEWEQWINELVVNGEYKSASEVMRAGLRTLKHKRDLQKMELEEIRLRIVNSISQAEADDFAVGSGEEAIKRAFSTAAQDNP